MEGGGAGGLEGEGSPGEEGLQMGEETLGGEWGSGEEGELREGSLGVEGAWGIVLQGKDGQRGLRYKPDVARHGGSCL